MHNASIPNRQKFMARGANCIIKTYSCHLYSLKTKSTHPPIAIQHFTTAEFHKAWLLQLLTSRYVLGTSKINYNNFVKTFIPLACGRSESMLYVEVTGDS